MLSTVAFMSFTPLVIGLVMVLAGTVWMYIEGIYARKEPTKKNTKRENRIIIATVIATLGIIVITIAGFLLVSSA